MNTFYVTFAGHRRIYEDYFEISDILEKIILDLLKTKEFVEFYLSSGGAFNTLKYAKANGKTIFNIFDEVEQKKKHGLYE